VTATEPATYLARHADRAGDTDTGDLDTGDNAEPAGQTARSEPGTDARDFALALLQSSPVYARVARLLGVATVPARRGGPHHQSEVAGRLALLPAGWRVVHSAGGDIDHLVVGPAGVFAVTVRHHPDAKVWIRNDIFKVNGRNHHHVRQARQQADRAAALLSAGAEFDVAVHGVIAVMGAQRGFAVKRQPRDVTVVNRKTITAYLHSRPIILGATSVDRIEELARRESTWQSRA
jgi:hypothetical protein